MSTPSLPRRLRALLWALVLLGVVVGPAVASTSMSPSEVLADIDVTLTFRTTTDPVDVTTEVSATFPDSLIPLACGAPDGWSCSLSPSQAVWSRGASLAQDDTFTLAVHTPAEEAELAIGVSDTRASGAVASSTLVLAVLPPEPEPSETEPTESASPTETAAPTETAGPQETLEPFRPPAGSTDDPISIRDLPSEPDDDSTDPVAERVIPKSGLGFKAVLAWVVVLLLLTSAFGFVVARANR